MQYEIELDPTLKVCCVDLTNGSQYCMKKGSIKWYPVDQEKSRRSGSHNRTNRYIYFKVETNKTFSKEHVRAAGNFYMFHKHDEDEPNRCKNTRRENNKNNNYQYLGDPNCATIEKGTHKTKKCCNDNDRWITLGSEYFLCSDLLYFILDNLNTSIDIHSV